MIYRVPSDILILPAWRRIYARRGVRTIQLIRAANDGIFTEVSTKRGHMKTLAIVLSAVLMVAGPLFTSAQTPAPKPAPTGPGGPAAVQAAGESFNWVPVVIGGVVVVAAVAVSKNNSNNSPAVATTGTTGT
jgi:hypothetical protein